jgi:lauroyl/myristoyl acyltransferase
MRFSRARCQGDISGSNGSPRGQEAPAASMRAGVLDHIPRGYDIAPRGYLRATVAVARSPRHGEWVLVHFGAGSFLRTDRLGALTTRSLVAGRSGEEAMRLVEEIEPGAGDRARRLICLLGATGAMALEHPTRRSVWFRMAASCAGGLILTAMAGLVRNAPIPLLARVFTSWAHHPIPRHAWRSGGRTVLVNLDRTYGREDKDWLVNVGRASVVEASRNYLYAYMCLALTSDRRDQLVERLFDGEAVDRVAQTLRTSGPVVGAFLHGPLHVPVANALRKRGLEVVRVIAARTHGMYVSARRGEMASFFGESAETTVTEADPSASGSLLRHLKTGRNVYVALDTVLDGQSKAAGTRIEWLGQNVERNDSPAWLAVRSGRPVVLWTTHQSGSSVILAVSAVLQPDAALPTGARVADLATRLYASAEAAIRQHPEAWLGWTYPSMFTEGPSSDSGAHLDSAAKTLAQP